jgi:polyisoprenoid-binding protein YceI
MFIGLFAVPEVVRAQSDYTLHSDTEITIEGTSTRSDWTVHAEEVEGSFGIAGDGSSTTVNHGSLSIDSANIKSRKSTIMDRLMHDALMINEHPEITYELTTAEPAGATAADGTIVLNTTGQLSLTGTTKDVQINVTGTRLADGKIRFTGSHAMKMSDYGMAAPTAMFGQLRTGDDITIHFDIVAAPAE